MSTAGRLYGQGSVEQEIVADAWATVGLPVSSTVAAFQ